MGGSAIPKGSQVPATHEALDSVTSVMERGLLQSEEGACMALVHFALLERHLHLRGHTYIFTRYQ